LQADSSQVEILNQTISKLEINSKERQKRHDDVIGKMKIAILDLNKQLSSERQKNATLEEQLARVNSGMERFKKDN
jgi:CII-binding regulator of phage lambda lysogenization HflD